MSLMPFELPVLHKILNYLRKRPRNRNILHSTYLFLTSKAFFSPTPRSLSMNLPLRFPGSAFPANRPAGFWEPTQFSRGQNGNVLDNGETTIPRTHWAAGCRPPQHPAVTCPAFRPLPPPLLHLRVCPDLSYMSKKKKKSSRKKT